MQSTRRVERAGFWWIVLLGLTGGVLAALAWQGRDAQAKVRREDAALAAARALLARAEEHRAKAGRYGWLEELGATAALPFATVPGAHGPEGRTDGYRIEVLLPTGRAPTGEVRLGTAGEALDPLLAARFLAIVARPLEPGVSGYRTFYLDETGRVYVQEGAIDAEGLRENALPRMRIERATGADAPGGVWRLLSNLESGS